MILRVRRWLNRRRYRSNPYLRYVYEPIDMSEYLRLWPPTELETQAFLKALERQNERST